MKKLLLLLIIISVPSLAQKKNFRLDPSLKLGDYKQNTIVVKFKTLKGPGKFSDNLSVLRIHAKTKPVFSKLNEQKANYKKNSHPKAGELSRIYYINFDPKIGIEQAINILANDPYIEYAEPVFQNYQPLYTPNDPLLSSEYQLNNINAYQAWGIQKGDPGMIIGIVDFGFDVNHEDLVNNMVPGWNVADNNNVLAGDNHGTITAGCSSATPDNSKGIAGTGYNCKFMPIRGSSDVTPGLFAGYEGLIYAVDHGCKVVNLSWGRMCGGFSQFEQDAIDYAAILNDVVVVVAAGNSFSDAYWYPAACDHVISVGYTNSADQIGYVGGFQNFGCGLLLRGTSYNDKVSIMAPGYNIFSTGAGNNYIYNTGSSFAAPIVSGAAALIRVQYPSLNSQQVIARLTSTADNINNIPGNEPFTGKIGAGKLNMYRALSDNMNAVNISKKTIYGLKNQPYLIENYSSDMVLTLINFLDPLPNIQVKLSCSSPDIIVQDSIAVFGNLSSKDTVTNKTHPFKIFVKPGTPNNTEVLFKAIISNGSFVYVQNFIEIVNPDYLDLNVNQILTTATSKGRFAYNDNYFRYGKGFNFIPEKVNILSEGGLIIGSSATKISDVVHYDGSTRNQSFTVIEPLAFDNVPLADFSASGIFTDSISNPNKNGIMVDQHVYAWKDAPSEQFVIHQYDIKNISGSDINSLYAGIFADWDMIYASNNISKWDSLHNMAVMYDSTYSNTSYAAISLLTPQYPQFYPMDDIYSPINPYAGGFTLDEKFKSISSGIFNKQSLPYSNDACYSIAGRMDSLKNNSTQTIAFAFIVGKNYQEVIDQSLSAKLKFCQVNKPIVNFTIKGKYLSDSLIAGIDTIAQLKDNTINVAKWHWDFGNGKTSNISNPQINFTKIGDYPIKLVVENSSGCKDSLTRMLHVVSFVTGTEQITNEDGVDIFPNPTEGNLFVSSKNSFKLFNSEMQVYNSFGARVLKHLALSEKEEISLKGLNKGLYFVNIKSEKKIITKKFIIQ